MKHPRRGTTRSVPEREQLDRPDGVVELVRRGQTVGYAVPIQESPEYVLAGKVRPGGQYTLDESGRRYPTLDAALSELDHQFDHAEVGQP